MRNKVSAFQSLPRLLYQGNFAGRCRIAAAIQGDVTEGLHRRAPGRQVEHKSGDLTNRRTAPVFASPGRCEGSDVLHTWNGPGRHVAGMGRVRISVAWMSSTSSSTPPPPKAKAPTKAATQGDAEAEVLSKWESTTKERKRSPLGPLSNDFKGYSLRWNAVQGDAEPPLFVAETSTDSEVVVKVFRNGKAVGVGSASKRLKAEANAGGNALARLSPEFAQEEAEAVVKIQKESRKVLEKKPTAYNEFLRTEIPKIKEANPKLLPAQALERAAQRWNELKAEAHQKGERKRKWAAAAKEEK